MGFWADRGFGQTSVCLAFGQIGRPRAGQRGPAGRGEWPGAASDKLPRLPMGALGGGADLRIKRTGQI